LRTGDPQVATNEQSRRRFPVKPKIIPFPTVTAECTLESAVVKGVAENTVMIASESGAINARCAFSCLVRPVAGDKVLISRSPGECFVLAVLERADSPDLDLDFPGNVSLNTALGGITLNSTGDLAMITAGTNRIVAADTQMTSGDLTVAANHLTTRVSRLDACLEEVSIVAGTIMNVAHLITQRADVVTRWVENIEVLTIGNLFQNVRKTLSSHAHEAVITATTDLRIDAERIHMG
jgi:hypothetical protein